MEPIKKKLEIPSNFVKLLLDLWLQHWKDTNILNKMCPHQNVSPPN